MFDQKNDNQETRDQEQSQPTGESGGGADQRPQSGWGSGYPGRGQGGSGPSHPQSGQGGYSNRYDPYRYSGGQQGNGQPPYQQQYNPYQYNPNSGWQQYNSSEPKNEWEFQDYKQLDSGKREKKRSRGVVVFVVAIICVLSVSLIALSGYGIWSGMNLATEEQSAPDTEDPFNGLELEGDETAQGEEALSGTGEIPEITLYNRPREDDPIAEGGAMSIPQVAESVLPSVVGVIKYDNSQFMQASGVGSGIIMTDDGYIITNAHVVAGGTDFKVELYDGTPYDARLIGYDSPTDLAVLKIEADDLISARFGDSTQIRVGETVVAIGNPASMLLKGSVTRGIVSAVNRKIDEASSYSMTYIQTDAAINPGNSGGPLCNEYGQVIGINSAKIVAAEFEGIGFAIPITDAQPVLQDLVQNGRVTGRVKLGISVYPIDQVDARNYNLPMGIQIVSIEPDSYMARTNAQKGDIITAIDGEEIVTSMDLRTILNRYEVGDSVTLTLYRPSTTSRGAQFDVQVQLMEDVD